MAGSPVFMIRRDNYKFIFCEIDPPQLYDLSKDPLETNNLATNKNYSDILSSFINEASNRWNSKKLKEQIISSQKQRRSIYNSMVKGKSQHWDYTPIRNSSEEYVRNHLDWTEAAARYRFPKLSTKNFKREN